jgi:hypothetical protein
MSALPNSNTMFAPTEAPYVQRTPEVRVTPVLEVEVFIPAQVFSGSADNELATQVEFHIPATVFRRETRRAFGKKSKVRAS